MCHVLSFGTTRALSRSKETREGFIGDAALTVEGTGISQVDKWEQG